MNKVQAKIEINALPEAIWKALINPEKIKLYTGSTLTTTWAEGSEINWSGEMQGTSFLNKGKVLRFEAPLLLSFTFWSGMGGDMDSPENYSTITYRITPTGNNSCILHYDRSNIPTELETQIFQGHIDSMLTEIKKISEEQFLDNIL